ncbi:MAG: hypothetical protein R2708_29025, partial [Vicinamibacterales bacterium]
AGNATVFMLVGLGLSFLYGLTFLACGRRGWLAYTLWLSFLAAPGFVGGLAINGVRPSATWLTASLWSVGWAVWLFVLFTRGLLAFLVMVATSLLLSQALPTLDVSAWYGSGIVAGLTLFAAVAVHATYRCVAWTGRLAATMSDE